MPGRLSLLVMPIYLPTLRLYNTKNGVTSRGNTTICQVEEDELTALPTSRTIIWRHIRPISLIINSQSFRRHVDSVLLKEADTKRLLLDIIATATSPGQAKYIPNWRQPAQANRNITDFHTAPLLNSLTTYLRLLLTLRAIEIAHA